MQVVVVQLDVAWEDKPKNQQRIAELLRASNVQAGSLILLSEMFDTGFSMNLAATAQSSALESEAFIRQLAQEHQSAVVGGVAGPLVGDMSSNEAVVFGPHGQELARYRKMRPFTLSGEDRWYGRGHAHQVFEWQGVKIAPFICYDLRFPELFRSALDDGAELFVVIACWPAVRSEHWVRLLQARAIENLALVVGANRCGTEPNLPFDGRSCAFDQLGQTLFEADDREQVLMAELDIVAMRKWRQKFPALRDRSSG